MNKKYMIVGIVTSIIVLALGVSLAYWMPRIVGEGKGITLKAAELKIIFTDTDAISASNIEPGWSYTKTFSVTSESDTIYTYDLIIKNLVNTFVTEGYLQYKITSTNDSNMTEYKDIPKSETASNKVILSNIKIEPRETQNYTIEFVYKETEEDQSPDMGAILSGSLFIQEHEPLFPKGSLGEKLLSDNPTILTRTDFDNVFTEENTGTLYKASGNETEDGNDVYYFAGNAQNNWVKFGKDQDNADLYWRIIRTNEDGSVRLLYIGPDPATISAFIKIDGNYMSGGSDTTGMYNSNYDNTMYVGYMYGSTGSLVNNRQNTSSAPIKLKTDEWYSKTLLVKKDLSGNTYDSYISKTAIYCNDRSGDAYSSSGTMYYGAANRLYHNNTNGRKPTYKCGYNSSGMKYSSESFITTIVGMYSDASVTDKFSVSTSKGGNGQLEYGVAQITADEIAYAGGRYALSANQPAWYYYNSTNGSVVGDDSWWTMTPYGTVSSVRARVINVYGSSLLIWSVSNTDPGIRPVLSLKSCVKITNGDGSSTTPYEVSVDSTCVQAEN